MSQVSSAVNTAASVDWNVVAAAVATFTGTAIVTIWGWFQGRKKIEKKLSGDEGVASTSVVVQDNQTLRESTLVSREVRDQLLLVHHALVNNCKAAEDNTAAMDDVLEELKGIRRLLENRG